MKSILSVHVPTSDAEWAALTRTFARRPNDLLSSLFERFRAIGCVSILQETAYIDRDFSAAFADFYATLFKPLSKFCTRLHFFAANISGAVASGDSRAIVNGLAGQVEHYLGDIVLRPLAHAPVSSSRVSATRLLDPVRQEVSIKSRFENHVLGAEFAVEAMPLAQQDTRTGACAQATMWMAGRHFHNRHSAPWFSVPDITEAALNPTDSGITRSLPAGSEYLTADNMVRALRAMGRHPVTYVPDATVNSAPAWQNVQPKEVIARYVDSGIPVILGLQQAGTTIGHAVLAVGSERTDTRDPATLPNRPTAAEALTHFLVNDDQRGVYCRLPINAASRTAEYPFCLETDIKFLLVPLPEKVFMTAETAELVARDILRTVAGHRHGLAAQGMPNAPWNEDQPFYEAILQDRAVARTYLTYGWRYKARMLRNQSSENLRAELLNTQLPKYVWVTEFSLAEETQDLDPCKRTIRAHAVVDATGSRFWESVLIVDVPGISLTWQYDPSTPSGDQNLVINVSTGSTPYWPKVRGASDYGMCVVAN